MSTPTQMTNYLDLLKIRQKHRKRALYFMGAIFLVSALATVGFGLANPPGSRELYIVVPINAVFAINYVIARLRLDMTNEAIEALDNLRA